MDDAIEEFGQKLVKYVREDTLTSCDVIGKWGSNDPTTRQLRAYDRRLVQEVLDILLPSIVDDAIFHMLRAIECEDIRVIYVADSGEQCDLAEIAQGELTGYYLGEEGWAARYSRKSE